MDARHFKAEKINLRKLHETRDWNWWLLFSSQESNGPRPVVQRKSWHRSYSGRLQPKTMVARGRTDRFCSVSAQHGLFRQSRPELESICAFAIWTRSWTTCALRKSMLPSMRKLTRTDGLLDCTTRKAIPSNCGSQNEIALWRPPLHLWHLHNTFRESGADHPHEKSGGGTSSWRPSALTATCIHSLVWASRCAAGATA